MANYCPSSLGAITYYLARKPLVQARLQKELDRILGSPRLVDDIVVATFEELRNITFLQDVINEGMRLHSTIGIGLPRIVPEGGLTIAGMTFAAGTEVSCPAYTIHRLKSVWGADADEFNPDRWARGDKAEMLKYFIPFSVGPRSVYFFNSYFCMLAHSTSSCKRQRCSALFGIVSSHSSAMFIIDHPAEHV